MGELPAIWQLELLKRTTGKRRTRAPEAIEASGARPLFVSAFAVAALGLVMAGFDDETATPDAAPVAVPGSAGALPVSEPNEPPAERRRAEQWDGDFIAWVARKYRYLLADTDSTDGRLMQLLLERENVVSDRDPALARIENELRALLPAVHYETFQLLKNSDEEQHHLLEYAGGISGVTPLTAQQQRVILEIKLRHKQAYEAALRQSGVHRETLSTAEREYAHRAVASAISAYRNGYLQEVKQMLEDEQYILLGNYESTEFERELQRLQMAINAK
jgi:hypothetical protein